jgi:hypothetical protein
MGVGVNETGRHDAAGCINCASGLMVRQVSDGADTAIAHRHIGLSAWCACAVNDRAAHNQQVVLVIKVHESADQEVMHLQGLLRGVQEGASFQAI